MTLEGGGAGRYREGGQVSGGVRDSPERKLEKVAKLTAESIFLAIVPPSRTFRSRRGPPLATATAGPIPVVYKGINSIRFSWGKKEACGLLPSCLVYMAPECILRWRKMFPAEDSLTERTRKTLPRVESNSDVHRNVLCKTTLSASQLSPRMRKNRSKTLGP